MQTNFEDPELDEMYTALQAMSVEAETLQESLYEPMTESVAHWLAAQFAREARKRLAATEGDERLPLLRTLIADWAILRQGEHSADRLGLKREALEIASRHADLRWKHRISVGMETLSKTIERIPEAEKALAELSRIVYPKFDPVAVEAHAAARAARASQAAPVSPTESDSIRPGK